MVDARDLCRGRRSTATAIIAVGGVVEARWVAAPSAAQQKSGRRGVGHGADGDALGGAARAGRHRSAARHPLANVVGVALVRLLLLLLLGGVLVARRFAVAVGRRGGAGGEVFAGPPKADALAVSSLRRWCRRGSTAATFARIVRLVVEVAVATARR